MISLLLDKCSELGLLHHMVVIFLILKEPPYCFLQWLFQIILPSTMHMVSHFSISLPTLVISSPFNNNHLAGVKWYLIVVLICISLVTTNLGHIFTYLLTIFMNSLEKYLCSCLPIFKSDCFFPLSCIISVSIWILIFYQMCGSYLWFIDIISYSIGCFFILFYCTEAFQFDIVPLVNFCLCSLCFCFISKNPCHIQFLGTFTLGFLLGVLCFQALNLSSYSISG